MKNKLLKLLFITGLVVLMVFVVRFVFGGNEDTWIKVNNTWIKHETPSSPAPR